MPKKGRFPKTEGKKRKKYIKIDTISKSVQGSLSTKSTGIK